MSKKKTAKDSDRVQLKLFLTRQEHKILKVAAALGDQSISTFIHSAVMDLAKKKTKGIFK